MKNTIDYFINNALVANVIFIAIFIIGAFAWNNIGKEELPEFESNWVSINTIYPGATPEEVELSVTKVLENELKSVSGIEEIKTISTQGSSQLQIIIDDSYPNTSQVYQSIQEAVQRTTFPVDVRELPTIRQFKSSEKAILDIGIYLKGQKSLDDIQRAKLQGYVLNFEDQLSSLKEVSSIEKSHYLKPKLNILVSLNDLKDNELSLWQVFKQIQSAHIRYPLGALFDKEESRVSLNNELNNPRDLKNVVIQSNYSGHGKKLEDICSKIENSFERTNSIFKVNGHEAIFLNVKKSSSVDILSANKKIIDFIENIKQKNKNIEIVLMDDESYAVKNRLEIISINAIVGFLLILVVLFIFLDLKTGFWVALGIPFSLAFTLIFALISGYTVNNMTLAAIIIVLGVVVDDAIIIAENISRLRKEGLSFSEAATLGVHQVAKPIIASIITTCLAFIPLLFFDGFFGKLIIYIPLIVCLMLFGSLFESLFILPSHLKNISNDKRNDWFEKFEKLYEKFLYKVLERKIMILLPFIIFIVIGGILFKTKMNFVMFPREESKEVFIKIKTPLGTDRNQTSIIISELEQFISSDKKNVVGVSSSIGLSRRGGETKENEASILVEVKPVDERILPLTKLIENWKQFSDKNKQLESVNYLRGRWGHSSSNAIEILVQENNDQKRYELTEKISNILSKDLELIDVEIDRPLLKKEFVFKLIQPNLLRYKIPIESIKTTLRSFLDGGLLYTINLGDEDVDVVLSVEKNFKKDVKNLLKLEIENAEGNLISLSKLVQVKSINKPINITRIDYKRSTMIYANLKKESKLTALKVADILEKNYFPKLNLDTSIISFKGEIEDSRQAKGQFLYSIFIVIFLIFLVLLVIFNSLLKPLIILSIVPFGLASIVYILLLHNMSVYGFFSLVGALGMIGVVVNDAIVMISRLEENAKNDDEKISKIAATRLRPIVLTTLTTVVGVLPTAYGFAGHDSMLSEMMLVMGWGLAFGTMITLFYVPVVYSLFKN